MKYRFLKKPRKDLRKSKLFESKYTGRKKIKFLVALLRKVFKHNHVIRGISHSASNYYGKQIIKYYNVNTVNQ
jgi:hypothetical protein